MTDWQTYPISQLRQLFQEKQLPDTAWQQLEADPRKGVQLLVCQHQHLQEKRAELRQAFQDRTKWEQPYWQAGQIVAGVDEVGRGPLAGPVVTAAVIWPAEAVVLGINDSKQLSVRQREKLYPQIVAQAIDVSIGVGSPQLIDRENIYHATELTMRQAVQHLRIQPDHLLVDAMRIPVDLPQTRLIKGDAQSIPIGAASIVAKVYRDHLMADYDQVYPGYGLAQNAGYGTKIHLEHLQAVGPCPLHRQSFAPVGKARQSLG
ncbi:ribonuclease HII [Lactobacillus sp. DCY120]|uniref:Ribonuclease HII n=1 Tax=Bombilactobacillus apium TaxID=2675299 RepID=A0A850R597_9LACO|nr:ribonuclease HII [Bombilactobacillus apium]NVY95772.1 ribonuclease HII [Bombilactobacillus apium]